MKKNTKDIPSSEAPPVEVLTEPEDNDETIPEEDLEDIEDIDLLDDDSASVIDVGDKPAPPTTLPSV